MGQDQGVHVLLQGGQDEDLHGSGHQVHFVSYLHCIALIGKPLALSIVRHLFFIVAFEDSCLNLKQDKKTDL